MAGKPLSLLSLVFAFPPGVSSRFPNINAAAHVTETRMHEGMARCARVRTVGLLPGEVFGHLEPRDPSPGLEHALVLWDRKPELYHWWKAGRALRRQYLAWKAAGDEPDVVLVKNFHPAYNLFVKWLSRQPGHPPIILHLADASTLGQKVKLSRRIRYRFKPLRDLDDQMLPYLDGCVSMSDLTARFFEPAGKPWFWAPGGFHFDYTPPPASDADDQPVRFGYFGFLGEYAGAPRLVDEFLTSGAPGSLAICGYGKQAAEFQRLAATHANFIFDGTLPQPSDCLDWAQKVDVLINPRSLGHGNENNFPSKLFEYAITGRAILSSRLSGVDKLMGDLGFYFDPHDFSNSFRAALKDVSTVQRKELNRRGRAIRELFLRNHTWDEQARKIVEFLEKVSRRSTGRNSAAA